MKRNHGSLYKSTLLENVIPFWEKHSLDWEHGGYYSCLDPQGKVYDTHKYMWLQGRQAWTFSMLYNKVDQNRQWLEIAKNGIDFLKDHGRDPHGNFYFSTTRQGQPSIMPYNIFSDCFAAMAFSQYSLATGDLEIRELAKQTYGNILKRKDNPKGKYEKNASKNPLQGFSLPMILSNLVLELEHLLPPEEVESTINTSVEQVMNIFLDQNSGLIYENVLPNGTHQDSFEGRLINPGHGIEAMWFIIDIGARRNDPDLIARATEVILTTLDFSWDKEFGGIYYFMDAKGHPPQQLEWNQKLWWVHLETLVALTKAYEHTGNNEIVAWYTKVHQYAWSHFNDTQYGEWHGYLSREGKVNLALKGGKWKGCFHMPRAMYQCWKSFENIEKNKSQL